jgi:hypothetical protein
VYVEGEVSGALCANTSKVQLVRWGRIASALIANCTAASELLLQE